MNEGQDRGLFYGVSVGPGDPELLTLKAIRVIREADCIAAPNIGHGRQTALGIVSEYITDQELIDCSTPMTKNRDLVEKAYDEIADRIAALLDEGKTVAMITLGDATIYSTFFYVHDRLAALGYRIEIVPGVTSFCAGASKLGISLCEGPENLLVAPVTSGDVDRVIDTPANKVFMKSAHDLMWLKDKLAEHGQLENASLVTDCGLPGEQIIPHFADVTQPTGYFSLVFVKNPAQ